MKTRDWLSVLWQDYKAWRCGLERVAPRQVGGVRTRGRIYKIKGEPQTESVQAQAKSEPKVTITAKVIRANGDIEIHRMDGTVERIENRERRP
jgi:hypothetical protein